MRLTELLTDSTDATYTLLAILRLLHIYPYIY